MRATAKTLHGKALSSMRTAMTAFNSPHDDGRPTIVVLHLQHAFEMLLKAALFQGGAKVFDKKSGRSIGFEAAINQSCQLAGFKVTQDEAGTCGPSTPFGTTSSTGSTTSPRACSTSTPGLR